MNLEVPFLAAFRNEKKRVESFKKLIEELPECNRLLLSWMIVHMTHVIERVSDTIHMAHVIERVSDTIHTAHVIE